MHLDQSLSFRKAITPWYDSNFICRALIFIMTLVFAFALIGIFVCSDTAEYQAHVWFPEVLAALSFFLMIKIFFRLKRRSRNN